MPFAALAATSLRPPGMRGSPPSLRSINDADSPLSVLPASLSAPLDHEGVLGAEARRIRRLGMCNRIDCSWLAVMHTTIAPNPRPAAQAAA